MRAYSSAWSSAASIKRRPISTGSLSRPSHVLVLLADLRLDAFQQALNVGPVQYDHIQAADGRIDGKAHPEQRVVVLVKPHERSAGDGGRQGRHRHDLRRHKHKRPEAE